MRTRRYHPLMDLSKLGPLSPDEYADFRSRLRHARVAVVLLLAYSLVIAVLHGVLKQSLWPGLVLPAGFAVGIYLLFRLLALKCPRCGAAPMASSVSVGPGQVQASRFVALNPKKCQKCGVRFEL